MSLFNAKFVFCTLMVGWGLAIAGCDRSPAAPTASVKTPDPLLPIYEVSWKFCANRTNAIVGSDASGCVQNAQPLYVWGNEKDYQPQGVLLRTSVPSRLNPHVSYRVALFSRGCYPKHKTEPSTPSYYGANRTLMLEKNFAANRPAIASVEVTAKRVESAEQLSNLANFGSSLTFGESCPRLDYNPLSLAS